MSEVTRERPKNAIYTRTGDQGTTSLISGRVKKTDPRIKAIGKIDSLNAQLGYLIDLMKPLENFVQELNLRVVLIDEENLHDIQNLLFTIGSQLADVKGKLKFTPVSANDVTDLEKEIDWMTSYLSPLKNFILPRGHPVVSWADVVRTTCRSAEIACLELDEIPDQIIPFLNRLSDYLFTLSRYLAYSLNCQEIIWESK